METIKKKVIASKEFGDLLVEVNTYGVDIYVADGSEEDGKRLLCFFSDAHELYKFIQDSLQITLA